MSETGFVSLVGAGPGDPELLTLKALRRLQDADVVVFDRLVSAEILALIEPGVSRVSVGKSPGNHCVPQHQINDILVNLARSGRYVVRLKGGDPYIFGRGGEEALVLRQQQIPYEVVPGITAASGCSSYAGIPLTHRGVAQGVRFVTGHLQNGAGEDIDWRRLADPDCTLVFYMSLSNIGCICAELEQAGLSPATPAAAIQEGSSPRQRKVIARLDQLAERVSRVGLESPVTIIVGEVVTLSTQLDWFQSAEDNRDDALALVRA